MAGGWQGHGRIPACAGTSFRCCGGAYGVSCRARAVRYATVVAIRPRSPSGLHWFPRSRSPWGERLGTNGGHRTRYRCKLHHMGRSASVLADGPSASWRGPKSGPNRRMRVFLGPSRRRRGGPEVDWTRDGHSRSKRSFDCGPAPGATAERPRTPEPPHDPAAARDPRDRGRLRGAAGGHEPRLPAACQGGSAARSRRASRATNWCPRRPRRRCRCATTWGNG